MIMFKLSIFLFYLLFIININASDLKSSAFDDFLSQYGRRQSLEINDINDITRSLLEKFGCETYGTTDCYNCLNSAKLQMNGLIGTTVEREEFKNVSIVILCYLMDLPQFCTYQSIPDSTYCYEYLLKQTSNMDSNVFNDYLKSKLKFAYSPGTKMSNSAQGLKSVDCIDAKTLVSKFKPQSEQVWTNELTSNIASDIISSLFNDAPIGCEYPYSSFFIDELYNSYLNKDQFTINELEQLMDDVGIPQYELENTRKKRSIKTPRRLLKKKPHNRRLKIDTDKSKYEKCYSAQDLIDIYQMSNNSIGKNELIILSPSLIYIYTKGFCNENAVADELHHLQTTVAEKYGYGTIAVFIVSLMGILGIFFLPCFNKTLYHNIIVALTSLAISTLICDALLHIMPVILDLDNKIDENKEEDKVEIDTIQIPNHIFRICIGILALYLFWLLEMMFYKLTGTHRHQDEIDTNNLIQTQQLSKSQLIHGTPRQVAHSQMTPTASYGSCVGNSNATTSNNNFVFPSVPLAFNPEIHTLEDKIDENPDKKKCFSFIKIKNTAWILLISDAIHNFGDGLAIGASFAKSINLGISTTVAIVCHEIPHELGNYAILIKCGFNHLQAILLNFLSSCAAFVGFYVGVTISSDPEACLWIFSLTIGMFLYIALVNLLPTIVKSENWKWKSFIVVNIFMWIGFSIMFLLVIYQEKLKP